ncbi:hypothetical protein [Flavobacterium sp. ov086]|uniref:hypothetical protein n=1 Tax=Flavobacterium sp. ov086 TaxID=1761785 RepID=UPI000B6FBB56|nr:hypothetical protein [Flavobacterium sp. ov086]SNR70476.1 Por secretion system C-terminal sorting domain-containing protein [Flavobacterium sp. ov086]
MKNVKLLFMMSLLFLAEIGFSQNYVTYSPMSKTIDVNSGVEGTVDILVNCYGSTSDPVFLNALQSCANNDGILSTSYTNGSILTPGQNTIIRYKFKKTVTSNTQIAYKFSTNGSCFQEESKMIKITVNYKPSAPISNNTISGNQTVYEGQPTNTITGTTPSGGSGNFTYSWQEKLVGGSWTVISGANGINYSPGIPAATKSYRRNVSSAGLTSTSNEVTITAIPAPLIENNTITIDGTWIYGNPLLTGGLGQNSYSYIWFVIDEDGESRDLTEITTATATLLTPVFDNYRRSSHNFKLGRIVYSGNQRSFSNYVDIPHIADIQNNIISNNGYYVTGSVPTGGIGDYTYSWALLATSTYIELDETTKDLDLTSHPNFFDGSLLIRIVTAGISSTSNKLALNAITAKALNKENMVTSAVYPNPTSGSINFTTGFSSNKEIEIIVYSEELRKTQSIFKGIATPNQIVQCNIPANYPKGIYYYKIVSENKEIKTGKIIFQ